VVCDSYKATDAYDIIHLVDMADNLGIKFGYRMIFSDLELEFEAIRAETLYVDMRINFAQMSDRRSFYWTHDGDEVIGVKFSSSEAQFRVYRGNLQDWSIFCIEPSIVLAEIDRIIGNMLEYLESNKQK
jgi:hypothetical protein